jgi:hypothetical protein
VIAARLTEYEVRIAAQVSAWSVLVHEMRLHLSSPLPEGFRLWAEGELLRRERELDGCRREAVAIAQRRAA